MWFSSRFWRFGLVAVALVWWPTVLVRAQGGALPTWQWLQSGRGSVAPRALGVGEKVVVDRQGNTYLKGVTEAPAQFGNLTLVADPLTPTAAATMGFVAKYDANGGLQWVQGTKGRVYDVAVDSAGGCYALVTGPRFGSTALPQPTPSLSVIKCGAGGQVEWAERVITIPDSTRGSTLEAQLAVDRQGQFYVGARYSGAVLVGAMAFTTAARLITVAAFDAARQPRWAISTGTGRDRRQSQTLQGLAVDARGRVHLAVSFTDTLTLGTSSAFYGPLSSQSSGISALYQLGAAGQVLWGRQLATSTGTMEAGGLAVDSAGTSYVSGVFMGRTQFGTVTLDADTLGVAGSSPDGFLLKIDPTGQQQWVRRLATLPPAPLGSAPSFAFGRAVGVDRHGEPYQLVEFVGRLDFGTQRLRSDTVQVTTPIYTFTSFFVAHYTAAGQPAWVVPMTAPKEQADWGNMAVGADGTCYLAGRFGDTLQLGGRVQQLMPGQLRAFLAKLGGAGGPLRDGQNAFGADAGAGLLMALYPNPAQHDAHFTLRAPAAGVLYLRVLNALGQLVWQQERRTAGGLVTGVLPVQQWAPGLYYVQAQCGGHMRTQPLQVQP